MASETKMLSPEEFASLLLVGNTLVNGSAPAIPASHSARLIALGYIAGRLRMTTPGRFRIYAGQVADAVTALALDEAPASAPASAQSIP
jgi:Mg2+/Co2+ transporter CorB